MSLTRLFIEKMPFSKNAVSKQSPTRSILLAGNPNVGKSSVFNGLTGLKQHTGNWSGKTVSIAEGICRYCKTITRVTDLPGTYSLLAHSAEEAVARDAICFQKYDAVMVVCDATCLERNLNLTLQILEITPKVLLCVNLMDEAERKRIKVSLDGLSQHLGIPVIGISAHQKQDIHRLARWIDETLPLHNPPYQIPYPLKIRLALDDVAEQLRSIPDLQVSPHWLALKLMETDHDKDFQENLNQLLSRNDISMDLYDRAQTTLKSHHIEQSRLTDAIATALITQAESIAKDVCQSDPISYNQIDRRIDRILTGKKIGYPLMVTLLLLTFFLTISVSNVPSAWLSAAFSYLQDQLSALFIRLQAPSWLHGVIVLGIFRTLGWVISVMLPPMAIFFPLFSILEDSGYLPRIAFNLDRPFQKCNACGKQSLTMCMGFGCNAAGVVGCRIMDSPRERLLAILTNSLVPCNGKFSTLIAILSIFFLGSVNGAAEFIGIAALLTAAVLLCVLVTFAITRTLSKTVLKGVPSAFTLELPPYRKPQIGRILSRSLFDRILFVLGRAVAVAIPAGVLIWLMGNITVYDQSLLRVCADFLEPLGELMGLDGVILLAFVLGFPANETIIPIILMGYLSEGGLIDVQNLNTMREIFLANGWTSTTAICFILFFLFHAPCSTTLLTIKKETGSVKYTLLAAGIPTLLGTVLCVFANTILHLVG